jgi:hypothetical protein
MRSSSAAATATTTNGGIIAPVFFEDLTCTDCHHPSTKEFKGWCHYACTDRHDPKPRRWRLHVSPRCRGGSRESGGQAPMHQLRPLFVMQPGQGPRTKWHISIHLSTSRASCIGDFDALLGFSTRSHLLVFLACQLPNHTHHIYT